MMNEFIKFIIEERGENEVALKDVDLNVGLAPGILDVPEIIDGKRVVAIDKGALFGCVAILAVNFPKSVLEIPEGAFDRCYALKEINVDDEDPRFASEDGVLFDKAKKTLLCFPHDKDADEYVVPAGVETIGEAAFWMCASVKNVVLPEGVKQIDGLAFCGCEFLGSVALPRSVARIALDAFGPNVGPSVGNTTLRVYRDSYAHEWAIAHNREIEVVDDEASTDETPSLSAAKIFQDVRDALEDAEIRFDEDEEKNAIEFKLSGSSSGLRWTLCRILARKNDFIVRMFSPIRCDVSNTRAFSTIVQLINRINFRLAQGNFELDFDTGEISFKIDVECVGLGSVPQAFVIGPVVISKQAWTHYQACFFDVIFGGSEDYEKSYALNCADATDDDD